mgnify:CR=1 FL=1
MKRIFLGGLLLAVITALALWIDGALHIGLGAAMFTGGIGVVLGLVNPGGPIARITSFLIGFLLSWAMFGVQAALLPQVTLSQIICAVVSIAIITLIAGFTKDRMPFWALLLGGATMVGAYYTLFTQAPQNFLTESVSSAGGALAGVAIGFIVAALMRLIGGDDTQEATPQAAAPVAAPTPTPVPNDPSILPTSN